MFTISIDVLVTTMKLSRPVGVFLVVVLVELEVVVVVLGDATFNEGLGWFNAMKKETLIYTANFTLSKFVKFV